MKKWVIQKHRHFSFGNILKRLTPRIGTDPVAYKFKLPNETWFPYKDLDDLDINKLAGYSYGFHHKNSIRIGWTPDFNKKGYFTLYFYIYNNGVRTIKEFTKIKADTEYSIIITLVPGINYVTFDMVGGGSSVKGSEKFIIPAFKLGYSLWWYFGGTNTAPKEMVAWID